MKLLITGANGQLGNELRVILKNESDIEAVFTDIDTLDICNKEELDLFVKKQQPNIVINCAAYTAVDKAEDDIETCFRINTEAVKNIGDVAKKYNFKVIHISTDYVFDGSNHIPYTEEMPTCPTNVYGKSKLEGELTLTESCNEYLIIRTSWLYSTFGNNFVKTMLRIGKEKEEINVIFDQIGTPTYAFDLAETIIYIVKNKLFRTGIYHFSNEGICSWYDFTKTIFELSGIECKVLPIESKEYQVRTPRPHYSVLNKTKIKKDFNIQIPYWKNGLERCLSKM